MIWRHDLACGMNDPQDALDDTRPAGCECDWEDESGHVWPAHEHDPDNAMCPLSRKCPHYWDRLLHK
jgi:hypothetical protein